MSEAAYIHPVGWEKFQHGVKRGYPWIKVYASLTANPKWVDLTYRQRGILQSIWLLYHTSNGEVANRPHVLGGLLGDSTLTRRDLESLNHAGFLSFSGSTDIEESREEEKNPPVVPPAAGRRVRAPKSAPAAPEPKSPGKGLAKREPNPAWDWLVAIRGEPLEHQRTMYGRFAADLMELAKRELNGAPPHAYRELFDRRRDALIAEWGIGKAGVASLVKHWSTAGDLVASGGAPQQQQTIAHRALNVAQRLHEEGQ